MASRLATRQARGGRGRKPVYCDDPVCRLARTRVIWRRSLAKRGKLPPGSEKLPLGVQGVELGQEFPLAELRDLLSRSGRTPYDLARALEWYDNGSPDSRRVRRALGLLPETTGGGYYPASRRRFTTRARAAELVRAAGMMPRDFGL